MSDRPIALSRNFHYQYLAEGAANVVYRLSQFPFSGAVSIHDAASPQEPPWPTAFASPSAYHPDAESSYHPTTPLIRLRKSLPHLPSVTEQQTRSTTLVKELFPPDTLVRHQLVSLPVELLRSLNDQLRRDERAGDRPLARHGTYLALDEPHGQFVQDMTAKQNQFSIQLKPKWLVQSPNAPPNARRCRTCALRAMRYSERRHHYRQRSNQTSPDAPSAFCPLDLGSHESQGISRAIDAVLRSHFRSLPMSPHTDPDPYLNRTITDFLLSSPILSRLQELQSSKDPNGVLSIRGDGAQQLSDDFQLATTLRDCTLFLRVTRGNDNKKTPLAGTGFKVEGLLGDLDLKKPEPIKVKYWRQIEERLINEGWYTGRKPNMREEDLAAGSNIAVCRLERAA